MNERLTTFINRLKKLNIDITLMGNYPWIYMHEINGKRVKERFEAEHGFTIGYVPLKNKEFVFLDIRELFVLIRKYQH